MSDPVTIQTIVHGNRIEVPAPPGFTDGQAVAITIQTLSENAIPASNALTSAFGILSKEEGEDLDRFLKESRHQQLLDEREKEL